MHAIDLHPPIVKTLEWKNEQETRRFAQQLASRPELANAFLALQGELGAGKTTLVRHLLHALGVAGRIKSPTYAVLEPYQVRDLSISHFDFFRMQDAREWEEAGFRELFAAPGLKLAEWPERVCHSLPQEDLNIHIESLDEKRRRVTLRALTPTGKALLL